MCYRRPFDVSQSHAGHVEETPEWIRLVRTPTYYVVRRPFRQTRKLAFFCDASRTKGVRGVVRCQPRSVGAFSLGKLVDLP